MPWSETTKMRERVRFVGDLEREIFSMTELCHRFRISRQTGYKWVNRYFEEGLDGLKDRPRAPKSCPHQTDARVVELLAEARRRHPSWGPKKLIAWLARRQPVRTWPAVSTAGEILKRLGLVKDRRRRRRIGHPGRPVTDPIRPNQLWTADYKGQFKTRDGESRESSDGGGAGERVHPELTQPSHPEQYGLPEAIRTGEFGASVRGCRFVGHPLGLPTPLP
jgi:transposase